MDYHLDWIYASLQVAGDRQDGLIYPNFEGKIKAQQEDVDFLIACDADDVCHMILIEAKGVTGWNNCQMTSKANRLREIFEEDGERWQGVRPHFVIMSPAEPRKLNKSGWPKWMTADSGKVAWVRLQVPNGLKSVARCDPKGKEDREGAYWTVVRR